MALSTTRYSLNSQDDDPPASSSSRRDRRPRARVDGSQDNIPPQRSRREHINAPFGKLYEDVGGRSFGVPTKEKTLWLETTVEDVVSKF